MAVSDQADYVKALAVRLKRIDEEHIIDNKPMPGIPTHLVTGLSGEIIKATSTWNSDFFQGNEIPDGL